MSWEIYVFSYRDGEKSEFDTADLRAVFDREALPHPSWPPQNTDFLYNDGHIRTDIAYHGPRSDGFVVYRIFGRTAIARLLEAAALFNCIICWPGDPCAAVASEATLSHLPPDMLADVQPAVTMTVDEFIDVVGFSSRMTKDEWDLAQARHLRWYEQHERNYRPN